MKKPLIICITCLVFGSLLSYFQVIELKSEIKKYCIQVDSLQNEIPKEAYYCDKEIEKIWS